MITVSELTTLAGVAPSTFYIYFADVDEVVLALLEEATAEMPDLGAYARGITLERRETSVRELVHEYLAVWDKYYALLRIRNLASDEGDARFRDARVKMLGPLLIARAEHTEDLRDGDLIAQSPPSA